MFRNVNPIKSSNYFKFIVNHFVAFWRGEGIDVSYVGSGQSNVKLSKFGLEDQRITT